MDTYLTYFDQLRYIVGLLAMILLLCHGILPARPRYGRRLLIGGGGSILLSLAYVPIARFAMAYGLPVFRISVIYWVFMSMLTPSLIGFLYNTSVMGIFFRAMLAMAAENFLNTVIYYLLSSLLFPGLSANAPILLILLTVLIYSLLITVGFFLLRPRVLKDENESYRDMQRTSSYIYAYFSQFLFIAATKGCYEFIITPLKDSAEYADMYLFLRFYLVFSLFLLSIIISFIMLTAYKLLTMRYEQQVITQMLKERKAQYEFSRENIEMINRQAHDLKHQLKALEMISDDQRRAKLAQARHSIDFYDAVVKTGNTALDTILTEKSVFCKNHDIRLSCTVGSTLLDKIDLVDLYTLLGNAIDNAIEAVDKLSDSEMKTISLTIRDQDQMIFLQVENYYAGDLEFEDGIPLTTKEDSLNHGYGVKSIRTIADRYGGMVMIRTEDQVFSLEVLLPT